MTLSYSDFLEFGLAWSPSWLTPTGGFNWSVVLAPPGMTLIASRDDFFALLQRRVEFHLLDWMANHADEMGVDPGDSAAIKGATVALLQKYLPDDLIVSANQSASEMASIIVSDRNPILIFHLSEFSARYPADPADAEHSRMMAECIASETTLEGWLIESHT